MAAHANLGCHDDTIESPIVQHIHSQNPIGIRDIMTPNGGPCQDAHFEVQHLAADLKVSHGFVRGSYVVRKDQWEQSVRNDNDALALCA